MAFKEVLGHRPGPRTWVSSPSGVPGCRYGLLQILSSYRLLCGSLFFRSESRQRDIQKAWRTGQFEAHQIRSVALGQTPFAQLLSAQGQLCARQEAHPGPHPVPFTPPSVPRPCWLSSSRVLKNQGGEGTPLSHSESCHEACSCSPDRERVV